MARSRSGRRADYEWTGACGEVDAVDLAESTNVSTSGIVFVDFVAPFTIARIRGHIFCQLDATATDERAIIAWGIGIVSTDARQAGSTPDPSDEPDFPWMWYGYSTITSLAETAASPQGMFHRLEVDTKAMRKVKPGQSVVLLGQVCKAADQAGTWDVLAGLRVLLAS